MQPTAVSRRDFATHLAERSVVEFLQDGCPQLAASIAYHVLFSIFPLAIVLAGIFGIVVHSTGVQTDVVDAIVRNVPLSASGTASLRRLLLGATGGLSALGLVGIVGLVYATSGMMASVRIALSRAWDVEQTRPYLKGKLIDLGLVFAVALLALVSLGLTIASRVVGGPTWLLGVLVPLVVGFSVTLLLYRLIPSTEVRVRDAWPPALGVAVVLVVAQNLFAVYVGHFANYNAVYGSLGTVIAFMFFVQLAATIFLFGAEVASEWPRARLRFARGEVEPGPPLREQVKDVLKGLWVKKRQEELEPPETPSPPAPSHRPPK